jgi:hypothetical protein
LFQNQIEVIPAIVEQTDHYKVIREFCDDPAGFVEAAIAE